MTNEISKITHIGSRGVKVPHPCRSSRIETGSGIMPLWFAHRCCSRLINSLAGILGSFSKLTIPHIYFGLQTIYDRQVREVLTDRCIRLQTYLCLVKVGKNEIHQFFVGCTRIALRNVVSCCLSHDGHRQPQYLATIGIDVFYRFEKYHQRIIVQCTESMGYTSKPTHFIGNCGISHINGRNHVIGRFNELI